VRSGLNFEGARTQIPDDKKSKSASVLGKTPKEFVEDRPLAPAALSLPEQPVSAWRAGITF
jgi:hypothetical protein